MATVFERTESAAAKIADDASFAVRQELARREIRAILPVQPAHCTWPCIHGVAALQQRPDKKSILIATYRMNADSSSTLRWTMTATALQIQPRRSYRGQSFTRLVLHLINGFREAQEIAHRYDQLSHLSDVELAARKMRREDLPRIALTGRA